MEVSLCIWTDRMLSSIYVITNHQTSGTSHKAWETYSHGVNHAHLFMPDYSRDKC